MEREQWTRPEIATWQLSAINRVWSTAKNHVPYYRELAQSHCLPSQFESLEDYVSRMPLLNKSEVRKSPDSFLAREPASGSWHRTGGSTGTPMKVYWERKAHHESLRTKYRMLQKWGIDIFDRSTFLWGHSGSVAPGLAGLKQRMRRPVEDALRNRLRLSAYQLGEKDLDGHLQQMIRFQPRVLYGYSSAVMLLAMHAKQYGAAIPSLRLVILTAEPADESMRSVISDAFNCDTAIEYGSVDCGVMATGDPDGVLRVREDYVLLESLPNRNACHDLVVTVLNNSSFPLMRYQIEDVTSKPIRYLKDGMAVMEDVRGRKNDILVSRSGRLVHSLAVKHLVEHYPSIRRFRAHQMRDGKLHVQLESSDEIASRRLEHKLSQLLDGYQVDVELCEFIDGNLAGKHRWVLSDLANALD
ncbi:MAG: hypothetical protein AAGJ83_04315 [Planctomycetota bacterium]